MIKKKIANIVFYKTSNTKDAEKLACIFYADGTVSNISFEEGIDACEEIVKEYGIKSKDSFQEMINKQLVHVLSAKEFTERFSSFVGKEIVAEPVEEKVNPAEVLAAAAANNQNAETPEVKEKEESADSKDENDLDEVFAQAVNAVNKETASIPEPLEETVEKKEKDGDVTSEDKSEEDKDENEEDLKDKKVETGTGEENPFEEVDETGFIDPEEELTKDGSEPIDSEIEDEDVIEQGEKDKPKGIKGFFKGIYEKLKKNKTVKKISACVLAFVLATGLFGCSHRKTLEGQMLNSNLATTTTTTNTNPLSSRDGILYTGNNDYYDNYSYEELVEVTKNETQKNAMINTHDALMHFNNEFASNYLESNKNVRASLKFDEMIALQMAYNDYSKKDIAAIFNGAEIRSDDLVRSYKDASLQLMGAYAMENSEHPVDMSILLETEEARAFYNNYHAAFLAAKEATGQDKLDKVKAFYEMVKSDFPITKEVRTEGISHSENYDMIEPYKLSVTPMIAAAEMMFQNLKIDYTLNDSEIDFINDLGLCNYAEETFQRIETITLTSVEDNTNPTYEQYRNAMISKLKAAGYYYVDDETRELTKLDSFQEAVNGDKKGNGNNYRGTTGGTKGTTTTTTRQEVETHTETTTTTHEEEVRINKPIPADVKAQIDAQIEAENEAARRLAEQQAELERQRLQAIEDENARRIAEEIRREELDLQNKLQNANNIINSNNSDTNVYNDRVINESDFGDHNVSFDQQHQDGHGNLNNSVQNITTNPVGDQTNVALPDPNETGKKFDQQSTYQTYTQTNDVQLPYTGTTTIDSTNPSDAFTATDSTGSEYQFWTEETTDQTGDSWTEVSDIQIDPEYQGYVQVSAQTNEQIVNDYVENLSNQPESYGEGYQYTK